MKTIYFKQLKSGNYRICLKSEATEKVSSKRELQNFWNRIQNETTNVYDRFTTTCKKARVIKARYRLSQTYYNIFEELYKAVK